MAKNQKTTIVTRGMISVSTKSKASSMLTQRVANSVKSGRFAEGVKVASKRDRAGLIKLADRQVSDHYVVTFENVIDAHDAALQNGGGIDGIKDEALIRSAIGRPYQEFTGFVPYPTVTDKAGCLLHALLHNHGFNDASKRTAWLVCNGFLYVEEHALILPIDYEWYDQLAVMVKEGWAVEQVTEWLAQFIINLEGMDDIIIAGDGDDL